MYRIYPFADVAVSYCNSTKHGLDLKWSVSTTPKKSLKLPTICQHIDNELLTLRLRISEHVYTSLQKNVCKVADIPIWLRNVDF